MNPDTTPRASTPTEENPSADPATGEVEARSFQIDRDGITELREINPAPVPETSTRIEENPPAEPATSELEVQFMDEDYPISTEEENQNLRRIAATPNCTSFVLYFVVLADRASYCATQALLPNFIRLPLPKGGNGSGAPPRGSQEIPGALGMGLQISTILTKVLFIPACLSPILGGWWADAYIDRYNALLIGVLVCSLAHMIQVGGAIPFVLQKGNLHALPPFIIGLVSLGFGSGIFQPNIAPIILDQNRHQRPYTKRLESGEKVIVDPELTNTKAMLLFYLFANIGTLLIIPVTYAEKFSGVDNFKRALRIIKTALVQSRFRFWRQDFWQFALPAHLESNGIAVCWTDSAVGEVSQTMNACGIFLYFPIYYLCGGIGTIMSKQAAAMTTGSTPNDLLNAFNGPTLVIAVPIMTSFVYPALKKHKIRFGPTARIRFGFCLSILSGDISTLVQWRVYQLSPSTGCGFGGALSGMFCIPTAYAIAYSRSPRGTEATITAVFLLMDLFSRAVGAILIPVTEDPYLLWIWGVPPVVLAGQT